MRGIRGQGDSERNARDGWMSSRDGGRFESKFDGRSGHGELHDDVRRGDGPMPVEKEHGKK